MDVSTYIQEGGVMMYVILLLQFPALFLGIGSLGFAYMKLQEPRTSNSAYLLPGATAAFGILVIFIGLIGWQMGLSTLESALMGASEDQVGMMRREGQRLASYPAIYGSIIGAPTLVAGVMGAFMVWRRPTK